MAVFLVVVVSRFVWVYPATFLPRMLSARIREREDDPTWKAPFIISWAGMRGVVSLAIAFSIPLTMDGGEPFPGRNLILFLTFTTVIGTLVVQGLTLPPLIRAAEAARAGTRRPRRSRRRTPRRRPPGPRSAAWTNSSPTSATPCRRPLADRLRTVLERRRNAVWERLGQVNPVTGETVDDTYRRLSREMIGAEREVFVRLRDGRYIDDEMLRTLLRRLDLEEAAAYPGGDVGPGRPGPCRRPGGMGCR